MEHSKMYADVLALYKRKFWDINRVKNAVVKNYITPEEFQEITGMTYEEE